MASKAVNIGLKDGTQEVLLAWARFDGDDCFEDFRITVVSRDSDAQVYEFGACTVRAVRKMKLFLSDHTQQSVSGGFRHPDIRTYDWHRIGSELKLGVKFEGSSLAVDYTLKNPAISITEEPFSYDETRG